MSNTADSPRFAHKPGHEERMWRDVLTPEGALIRLRLADASERAGALLLDAIIMLVVLVVVTLALAAVASSSEAWEDIGTAIWFLFFFILRSFYFTAFEMSRRAATPGKRIMKLRVVAREGRQLTANAVFARNVMRELEVFLPFSVLFFGGGGGSVSSLITLCLIIWLATFVLMPFFNKDKLRGGDMVAGTWVIRNPKIELEKDISLDARDLGSAFQFTQAQLSAYGVHELQVLEDVLRGQSAEIQKAVAERIRKRIGWVAAAKENDRDFLDAFYKGLRKKLETEMLFGRKKRDKFDTTD